MWKLLIAGLLVVHGLIHAIGIATVFGGASFEGMSGSPTLRVGGAEQAVAALWGVAMVALVGAGLGLLFSQSWWAPLALAGAAVSMVPVVVWWGDAWVGAVANALVVVAVVAAERMPSLVGPLH